MQAINLIGQLVSDYKITEEIGIGGIATVYKAYQAELDRAVAIKMLHYREAQALARFAREAKAIANLRHRNLLRVYEYGEHEGIPYLVLEYIAGGTLADQLIGEPMPWQQAVSLILQLGEVLDYAHNKGVIHRDVKPSNILMAQSDWPLLADFGLVKLSDDWEEDTLTKTGTSLGTPSYMSPEQARGVAVDERTDIYSLAVVLFELVTGRLPFNYPNPNKQLLAHISEAVPLPREINPECPLALEQVILKALEKNAADRYTNMAGFVYSLKNVWFASTMKVQRASTMFDTTNKTVSVTEAEIKNNPYRPPHKAPSESQPKLISRKDQAIIEVPIKQNVIIGRTHRTVIVDLNLAPYGAAEAGISRRHATFTHHQNQWFVDDLSSMNGTFVNGIKVTPGNPVRLKEGDVVRFSQLSFTFQL